MIDTITEGARDLIRQMQGEIEELRSQRDALNGDVHDLGQKLAEMHEAAPNCLFYKEQAEYWRGIAQQAWQPIETAPKDGTRCLFLERGGMMRVDWWNPSSCTDRFWQEKGWRDNRYMHWMPLPSSPVVG